MNLSRETFLVEQWIETACELGEAPELIEKIELKWSGRMTTCLGKASRLDYSITLARKAWPLIALEERRETVFHEVAHLIALHEGGLKAWAHGPLWRRVMARTGYPNPERCHRLTQELAPIRRKVKRYLGVCGCETATPSRARTEDGKHLFTAQVAKKIEIGRSSYTCRCCRQKITLTPFVVKV